MTVSVLGGTPKGVCTAKHRVLSSESNLVRSVKHKLEQCDRDTPIVVARLVQNILLIATLLNPKP